MFERARCAHIVEREQEADVVVARLLEGLGVLREPQPLENDRDLQQEEQGELSGCANRMVAAVGPCAAGVEYATLCTCDIEAGGGGAPPPNGTNGFYNELFRYAPPPLTDLDSLELSEVGAANPAVVAELHATLLTLIL